MIVHAHPHTKEETLGHTPHLCQFHFYLLIFFKGSEEGTGGQALNEVAVALHMAAVLLKHLNSECEKIMGPQKE